MNEMMMQEKNLSTLKYDGYLKDLVNIIICHV